MADPIVLRVPYNPLYLQVRDRLLEDTDPQEGLLAALGAGAASVFPDAQFAQDGPTAERPTTPTPFIVVFNGGKRAADEVGRELEVIVEVHDDPDHGIQRWPGLVDRVYTWLQRSGWRPASDSQNRYATGLYFKSESPDLADDRFATTMVQLFFCCMVQDRSSLRGRQG